MKKIIITLAAALAVIAGVTAFKNIYSCELPIKNRGIKNALQADGLEVLFLGSSAFRSDIDMGMMDEAYDGKAYDIAYGGNQLVAAAVQYDEISRRAETAPKLMVFELGPMMLTQDVALSDSRVIWDLSFEGKKELWERMYEAEDMDFSDAHQYFMTSGMDDLITFPVTEPFYATRYYKGAKTEIGASPGEEYLESEEFDISGETLEKAQAKAVRDIVSECKRDGQEFIFVETPRYHRLSEDPTFVRYREEFVKILDECGAPYILASDMNIDTHDPVLFEDMNHMSEAGRKAYTAELVKALGSKDQ